MCSRVFVVVYMGLILATAGFCLTIAGWFTPSENISVYGVRRAGPVLLVIGIILLIVSCMMCAIAQDRCCDRCVKCYHDRQTHDLERRLMHAIANLRAAQNHVIHPNQLAIGNNVCEACNMERPNYVVYLPPNAGMESPSLHNVDCQALDIGHYRSPRLERILHMNQLRSSPHSYGYHESEGTTDSGDTPSTYPLHNLVEPSCSRSKHNNPQRAQHGEAAQLIDNSISQASTTPFSTSNPRWVLSKPMMIPDEAPDSSDDIAQSTPTTSPNLTPSSSRKYSINASINPRLGACVSTKELLAVARSLTDQPDPVWTPQITQWSSSTEEVQPPPPYKSNKRHQSAV